MIFISLILYLWYTLTVMEQIRSGELLHYATQKKKEEKKKLKKL